MEQRRDEEEYKHVCKLCNKRFPSGKSLGGHMRSHVIANAKASAAQKLKPKKVPNFDRIFNVDDDHLQTDHGGGGGYSGGDLGGGSYGLRENPKKSWRVDDDKLIEKQERICKKCGKGFQSLKALCGHMSCHSNKGRNMSRLHSYDDDDSWDIEEEFEMESQSDNNNNNVVDGSFVVVDSFSLGNGCSSNVSEIEHEQEEVAMCLMMLSRDSGHKIGLNFATESSDNNSVILEGWSSSTYKVKKQSPNAVLDDGKTGNGFVELAKDGMKCVEMDNSDSGYFENGAKELESDDSFGGYARNYELKKHEPSKYVDYSSEFDKGRKQESDEGRLKRHFRSRGKSIDIEFDEYEMIGSKKMKQEYKAGKYECSICQRSFKTHQALGGHIITHKRNNGGYKGLRHESEDHQSVETSKISIGESLETQGANGIKKAKVHKCPFCPRVFKSGQALGGHKRSHLIGCSSEDRANLVQSVERHSMSNHHPLLDLNLPAPNEEDAGGGGGGGHS